MKNGDTVYWYTQNGKVVRRGRIASISGCGEWAFITNIEIKYLSRGWVGIQNQNAAHRRLRNLSSEELERL